jgi:flagellar hook-length control protein FliK
MQTIPTATTAPMGQAPQPSAAASAGGDGSIFAALIQALTGGPVVAAAATGASGLQAPEPAGDGDAPATDGEGRASEAGEVDPSAITPLPGLELPLPPVAALAPSLLASNASGGEGPAGPQPAAASAQSQAAAMVPSASAADAQAAAQTAAPPSAQAVELAKMLGAGTQVHVTAEAAAPPPPPPSASAVAVAAALEGAPAAAVAEPLVRTVAPEPKKPAPAAKVGEAVDAEAVKTPTAGPALISTAKPADPKHHAPEAAPTQAAAAADGSAATSSSVASPTVHLPQPSAEKGNAETAAPEPGAAAIKGNDGQAPATQAPTSAGTAGAQPALPAAERAEPPLPAPPAAGQVSVHIAKAVRSGTDRIHIQLAPAALGRVEIALDLSDGQQVRATISAETKEALELLRADARVLERALQDAGLKADPGSLSFQLRDQGARPGHDGGSRSGYGAHPQAREPDDPPAGRAGETPAPAPLASRGRGRIDIHA